MKKRILLFTAAAAMGYVTLSSNGGGPATHGNGNRTGAKGTTATCAGGGCHGTGTTTTVTITVDSTGGVATTRYVPGMAYTVKIHGVNTSALTRFGFQFAAVSGSGASQVQAGTFSGLPTGVASVSVTALNIIEHTAPRNGVPAGTYDVQFTWTAPATAVGNITMYSILNAVNTTPGADMGDIAGNTSITLTPITTTTVPQMVSNIGIAAYPNPVANTLNLQAEQAGVYSVLAYDLTGRIVANEQVNINGTGSINTNNWAAGLYQVVVRKDAGVQVIPVVKQ